MGDWRRRLRHRPKTAGEWIFAGQSEAAAGRKLDGLYILDHTWCQALALLPPELGWDEISASEMPCKTLLLRTPMADRKVNPLSLVGLSNWYKWVRLGGAGARHHLDPVIERAFLVDEIQCYEPNIVVFQSASFRTRTYLPLVKTVSRQFKVVVLYHPSRRGTLGHHMRSPGDLAQVLWP
jgi:hypothetical protein